jgi:UDP-N-acetyl-D-mannosaminuronate dehydrogenase
MRVPQGDEEKTYPNLALRVGVVGLGYVGLPLVVSFAQSGAEVIALD